MPATFLVRAGGLLDPPSISAPAFIAVLLTVISRDGRAHKALLRTPVPHTLAVPANGRASLLIGGQRAGRYPLSVDGRPPSALMIGGEPGP